MKIFIKSKEEMTTLNFEKVQNWLQFSFIVMFCKMVHLIFSIFENYRMMISFRRGVNIKSFYFYILNDYF